MKTLCQLIGESLEHDIAYCVLMTYDIKQNDDSNLNTCIKNYLIDVAEWKVQIPTDAGYLLRNTERRVDTLPETTLVKTNTTVEQAEKDFRAALLNYNLGKNSCYEPAKGHMVAFDGANFATFKS